jgi:hypothetical protein
MCRCVPLLVLAALATCARAEPSPYCAAGRLDRLVVTRTGDMKVVATIALPDGFDPTATATIVALGYEPETDPSNDLLVATLPVVPWKRTRRGFRYRDATGSVAGIRRVVVAGGRVVIERRGAPFAGLRPGAVRLALDGGRSCGRTCGGRCTPRRRGLRCRRSRETALCGVMSGCELLGASEGQLRGSCLVPYPSDLFTTADATRPTGLRRTFDRRAMPANKDGVAIDPAPWSTLDGFSPGPIVVTHFPVGVDLAASKVPQLGNPVASVGLDAPTILLEADAPGCVRVPHFAENDESESAAGGPVTPPSQAFLLRPLVRLRNATRYIVALRGLVAADGAAITAPTGFAALRDGTAIDNAAVESRRAHTESVIRKVETECGFAREELILAWDFTTASDDALERWLVHMRDETFAGLGAAAPAFAVTSVEDDPFGDPRICRRVRGVYSVPLYATTNSPGARLNLDPATNLPVQNGVAANVPFTAIIPCSLVTPAPHAGRPVLYGHGLLGTGESEVSDAPDLRALTAAYGFVAIATDWQGMARDDTLAIVGFLGDLSGFPVLPERLHQGILNQLVLGHLIGAPDGLATDPAFRYPDGMGGSVPVIDASAVYFYGNSMGGIYGGTLMALAQEITRGVIGVGAANFSTLLQRSHSFGIYGDAARGAYPDDLSRMVSYPLVQELWDRVDPNGWYHHTLDDPLPATPAHRILFHMATNDAEVPNLATEVMIRSMGVSQLAPVVQGRFGIGEQTAPVDGSALLESDGGYAAGPTTNRPPPAANGAHEGMRALPAVQAQIDAFLRPDGLVQQFCAGPCDPQ